MRKPSPSTVPLNVVATPLVSVDAFAEAQDAVEELGLAEAFPVLPAADAAPLGRAAKVGGLDPLPQVGGDHLPGGLAPRGGKDSPIQSAKPVGQLVHV